ncbi:hypothetical protein [Glycomyces sp. NPDC021274]|jgi:hypothetical protein|uniref:hypothetical protein n=1 Tax=Glycomyces sp. NPDC021274 TaxID=3155120 RepID=UPI0034056AB1
MTTTPVRPFCAVHNGRVHDACLDCRVESIREAADHLRGLTAADGFRELVGDAMPTTLAEAVAELEAYAVAVAGGDFA